MRREKDIEAFFALVRAGLWADGNVNLNLKDSHVLFKDVDWEEVYNFASEQSVVGLVAAGLEDLSENVNLNVPLEMKLQIIGEALQIEQRNKEMNAFIADLIAKMRTAGIYTLLVKGQGIAQCYERPLWRTNGDVDFFMSDENYQKAKGHLQPLASSIEQEGAYKKHLGMIIKEWDVELHGSLRCGLSAKSDKVLDEILRDTFYIGNVRSWDNGGTQIFMLSAENDAYYVFAHFLSHFYKGGIGLRQICDWCRLLWKYKDTIQTDKLESYIKKSGLESEWKAFGAFVVEHLGMPVSAVPLLNDNDNLMRKAERIRDFILMSGNFGHNRDMSYYDKYPYLVRKCVSMGRRIGDLCSHAQIFPLDSIRFLWCIMLNGFKSALKGE